MFFQFAAHKAIFRRLTRATEWLHGWQRQPSEDRSAWQAATDKEDRSGCDMERMNGRAIEANAEVNAGWGTFFVFCSRSFCKQALTLKFRLLSIRFTSQRLSGMG